MTAKPLWYADIDVNQFAQRLKLLREARHLSQTRLADLLRITPRSYNRWERGGNLPQLDMLIKIADVLQVSLDELVGRSPLSSQTTLRNHELHTLYQHLDELPDEDQKALIAVIDGLMKKTRLRQVASS